MKKAFLIFILIGLTESLIAQRKLQSDSVQIFASDIYSNYNNINYGAPSYKAIYAHNILDSNMQAAILFSHAYFEAITTADSYFNSGDYTTAASYFEMAFTLNEGRAMFVDRFKLAASYAEMDKKDSALKELASSFKESTITISAKELQVSPHFKKLHSNKKWKSLIKEIKEKEALKPAALKK